MNKIIKILAYIIIPIFLIGGLLFFVRNQSRMPSENPEAIPEQAAAMIEEAESFEDKGDFFSARQLYKQVLTDNPLISNYQDLQNKIYDLNIKTIFSSNPTESSIIYEVVSGDSLIKIANKFNTTVELIQKANGIKGDLIKPGMKLKIYNAPFYISVDKSQNILTLISNDEVVKVYNVSTGKDNCTPTGMFKIVNKLINPPWYSAKGVIPPESPENVLGTRWLGIDKPGYGIHGTITPETIGSQCTEGCVRMRNSEVEELYALVPVGTAVTIVD